MVDFNLQSLRTKTFKGYVQFQIPGGTAYYRLKERQALNVAFNWQREAHYSDSGAKALDPAGHNHTFNLRLKFTADLVDDVYSASSNKETISYWMYQNAINEPIEITFVTTLVSANEVTVDAGDKYIHMKFQLDPISFGPITFAQGGSNEITIAGEVVSIDYIKRTDNPAPPA